MKTPSIKVRSGQLRVFRDHPGAPLYVVLEHVPQRGSWFVLEFDTREVSEWLDSFIKDDPLVSESLVDCEVGK